MLYMIRPVPSSDPLLDELSSILVDAFTSLSSEGDKVASEIVDGTFETVKVIDMGPSGEVGEWELQDIVTRLPDGRFFCWRFIDSRHEAVEDIGPGQYGKPNLQELVKVRKPLFRKQMRRHFFRKGSLN